MRVKSTIRKDFGARVRELREATPFSQEAFADHVSMARSYMSRVERGLANPSLDAVAKLAGGLGVSVADLFASGPAEKRDALPELVPFASDGSHFDKKRCKHPDSGYTVGEKEDAETFAKYEDALDYLRRMGTAKWRRPNVNGNWGLVTATGWREKP
jgi:transcriptional regulator with XRE-family HTH domain